MVTDPYSEQDLLGLLDLQSEAFFIKSLDGTYQSINSAGARMLGCTPDEVIGLSDREFFDRASVQTMLERERAIISSGTSAPYVSQVLDRTGQARVFESTKQVLRDRNGQVSGILGMSREVTSAWKAQLENQANRHLFRRCLSEVSHDLKTPITALSLRLQLLRRLSCETGSGERSVQAKTPSFPAITGGALCDVEELTSKIDHVVSAYRSLLDSTELP